MGRAAAVSSKPSEEGFLHPGEDPEPRLCGRAQDVRRGRSREASAGVRSVCGRRKGRRKKSGLVCLFEEELLPPTESYFLYSRANGHGQISELPTRNQQSQRTRHQKEQPLFWNSNSVRVNMASSSLGAKIF